MLWKRMKTKLSLSIQLHIYYEKRTYRDLVSQAKMINLNWPRPSDVIFILFHNIIQYNKCVLCFLPIGNKRTRANSKYINVSATVRLYTNKIADNGILIHYYSLFTVQCSLCSTLFLCVCVCYSFIFYFPFSFWLALHSMICLKPMLTCTFNEIRKSRWKQQQ